MSERTNEQLYFDALKRIARGYRSAESLLRKGDCGLDGTESLEYAYDNIQSEAENAIRGKRRPVDKPEVTKKVKREAARDMKADMLGENGNGCASPGTADG